MALDFDTMMTFEEAAVQVYAAGAQVERIDTTAYDFALGLVSPDVVVLTSPDSGERQFELAKSSLADFIHCLGYPRGGVMDNRLSHQERLALLCWLVTDEVETEDGPRQEANESGRGSLSLKVEGDKVVAVNSGGYASFTHSEIVQSLHRIALSEDGGLPSDLRVMPHSVFSPQTPFLTRGNSQLNLRLVSPDWRLPIGRGAGQEFYGNLVISNRDDGGGACRVQAALTRAACLNTTIGQEVFQVEHRYGQIADFEQALQSGIANLSSFFQRMQEQMRALGNIQVKHALDVFHQIGESLKLPDPVLEQAISYWEDEGAEGTMYGIVQAVSAGTRRMVNTEGRRKKANWTVRQRIEENIWTEALRVIEHVQAGGTADEVFECPTCHSTPADRERQMVITTS